MNRVMRAGLLVPAIFFMLMAAAWVASGGGYGGSQEYYPVTVRMWLDDAFVGGIAPAMPSILPETAVLDMLAAGNDLIYVGLDAPRCPVMSVAWVHPDPGTPADARIYNATIRCSPGGGMPASGAPVAANASDAGAVNATIPPDYDSMTFRDIEQAWTSP